MLRFDIKSPVASAEQLTKERAQVEAKMRKYEVAMFPLLGLSLAIGYLLTKALYPLDSEPEFLQSAVRSVTTGISLAVALLGCWFYLYERWLAVYKKLEELPLEACEEALKLADADGELEAFRLAVVSRRSMVMGDLVAMQDHANSKETERAAHAERAQAEAAHAALHNSKLRRASSND